MARKSGSLNLKGIFDTWSLFDWIFLSSLDEQGDPAPTLVTFVGEATDTDTGVVNAFVALVHSNYTSQKKKNISMTNKLAVFGLYGKITKATTV